MPSVSRSSRVWICVGLCVAALGVAFRPALVKLATVWATSPEYSHGFLIPLVALFLIWQRRDRLDAAPLRGAWAGLGLVVVGVLLDALGNLAALYTIQLYGLLAVVYGLTLTFIGWRGMRILWAPLFILLLAIPLPEFLLNNFSAQLQLLSSQIGVAVIRLFGISVFLEGNVIDLGGYRLQVAEACSGLRYLFPLMTLGFIMACFYQASPWKRTLLFLSSIPVTILMNSLRIGLIGVTVEYWGISMAEGFLHQLEGWVVFMASSAVLVLEIVLLNGLGRARRPWREVFGIELPARGGVMRLAPPPAPRPAFTAATVALVACALGLVFMPARAEAHPGRASFAEFPSSIDGWRGRRSSLEPIFLDTLKLDDYVLADFVRPDQGAVNFYAAWYDSQRAGQSAHSPRTCLPGGGWRIRDFKRITLPGVQVGARGLPVNRVLIELGDQREVVYYWFQQRGRVVTSEYLVKWYIFWDALTRNRTDGALVRLVAPVLPGGEARRTDAMLQTFAHSAVPLLARYIPN